jgi:hypothetical protein
MLMKSMVVLCAGLLALFDAPIAAPAQNAPVAAAPAAPAPVMEPKAIEILKAASDKLAAANTLQFTAVSTYERAARNGQPLYYSLVHQVTVERPDKMRVITPGGGTSDEFYYDGKTMMAYVPSSDLVAVADAPPTIDQLIDEAWDKAAIYFPFSDIIASNPYAELSKTLKSAFYVGRSIAVGGVAAEIWIGVDDHLPRLVRAVYANERRMRATRLSSRTGSWVSPCRRMPSSPERRPRPPVSNSLRPATLRLRLEANSRVGGTSDMRTVTRIVALGAALFMTNPAFAQSAVAKACAPDMEGNARTSSLRRRAQGLT